jgi:Ca2+-binding RTX toxin-like protein
MLQIRGVLTRLADDSIDPDQRNAYEEEYMLLANQKSDFVLDAIRYRGRVDLILITADESYVNETLLYGGFYTAWPIRGLLTRLADGALGSDARTPFIDQYIILANQASDFVLDAIHNRRFDLIFDGPDRLAPIPKTLLGGDGADRLMGNPGDTLIGGAGDDLLEANNGQVQASGGDGNDTISARGGGDGLFGDAGDDLLEVMWGAFSLSGGSGADTLSVSPWNDLSPEWVSQDWVSNSRLEGGDGADSLIADAGNDTLIGGAGDDTLIGGAGDDVILAGGTSLQDIMSLFTL